MINRITTHGYGIIKSLALAGTAVLPMIEINNKKADNMVSDLVSVKSIYDIQNNKLLVEAYRKIQHKYYPEKDCYIVSACSAGICDNHERLH